MTTPPDRAEERERERAKFEAWARSAMCMEPFLAMRLSDGNRYESLQIESAWQAWLARARSGDDSRRLDWLLDEFRTTDLYNLLYPHYRIGSDGQKSRAAIDAKMAEAATPAREAGDGP